MNLNHNKESRGALIVIEGLDRAGKTSQCQLLVDNLTQKGHNVKYIKFPGNTNTTCIRSLH